MAKGISSCICSLLAECRHAHTTKFDASQEGSQKCNLYANTPSFEMASDDADFAAAIAMSIAELPATPHAAHVTLPEG